VGVNLSFGYQLKYASADVAFATLRSSFRQFGNMIILFMYLPQTHGPYHKWQSKNTRAQKWLAIEALHSRC